MNKEVKIVYSYTKQEYLVRLFEDGILFDWKITKTQEGIINIINDFYR